MSKITNDKRVDAQQVKKLFEILRKEAEQATNEIQVRSVLMQIEALTRTIKMQRTDLPRTPVDQALELDSNYRVRPHLTFLSERIAKAVTAVENGDNRLMTVSMPPRAGKTLSVSIYTPLWILRRHPEWKIVTASYDPTLSGTWARDMRNIIRGNPQLGIQISPSSLGTTRWNTTSGGGVFSTSVRGALTGRGANCVIIDDPIRDYVEAHSSILRQNLWDWWLSVVYNRLEPPYLVIVVATRWHADDFIGRLLSPDYEGDPEQWERISLPAVAESGDILGRDEGDPLLSPLFEETVEEAKDRWIDVKEKVGSGVFSSLYQQRPAPAKGAVFESDWWKFWTTDPEKVTSDKRVLLLNSESLENGQWVDSWDTSFKAGGDWVVGQRWVRVGPNRFLIAQKRGRWSFTETLVEMRKWALTDDDIESPYGHLVHERLIEDKANGSAIIDTLKEQISGIKPINPTVSKEARARSITPEIESGHVYLPRPGDMGNTWVNDLLGELRNFPNDVHDDCVDSLTQALEGLRTAVGGQIIVPGRGVPHLRAVPSAVPNTAYKTMKWGA